MFKAFTCEYKFSILGVQGFNFIVLKVITHSVPNDLVHIFITQ
uniref:Uncharacterized protein n=1 Tax=Arundo donax TaxID=35708 RepID=A0A0A9IBX6_ARUDO